MDINMVATLASAGASLYAAMDCCESGSREWNLIFRALQSVEVLVTYEATNTWPTDGEEC